MTTITLSLDKLKALTQSLIDAGVKYGLGKKAEPLSLQAGEFDAIDCSGFVRWAIYHDTLATTGTATVIPDGSVTQHEWVEQQGFERCSPADGHVLDDKIRIAFLSPEATSEGIGHVLLIANGETYESHGSTGPASREWGSAPWMGDMDLFVLAD